MMFYPIMIDWQSFHLLRVVDVKLNLNDILHTILLPSISLSPERNTKLFVQSNVLAVLLDRL